MKHYFFAAGAIVLAALMVACTGQAASQVAQGPGNLAERMEQRAKENGESTSEGEDGSILAPGTADDPSALYGSWRMVRFTDSGESFSVGGVIGRGSYGTYLYSELTVYSDDTANYRLEDWLGYGEMEDGMTVEWLDGPLFEGCENTQWHVRITSGSDIADMYITVAGGQLLRAGADGSLYAVYERLDISLENDPCTWDEWLGGYYFEEESPSGALQTYDIRIDDPTDSIGMFAAPVLSGEIVVSDPEAPAIIPVGVVGNTNYIELVYNGMEEVLVPSTRTRIGLGDVVLSLYTKGGQLYTIWRALQPTLPENNAPGNYFSQFHHSAASETLCYVVMGEDWGDDGGFTILVDDLEWVYSEEAGLHEPYNGTPGFDMELDIYSDITLCSINVPDDEHGVAALEVDVGAFREALLARSEPMLALVTAEEGIVTQIREQAVGYF